MSLLKINRVICPHCKAELSYYGIADHEPKPFRYVCGRCSHTFTLTTTRGD